MSKFISVCLNNYYSDGTILVHSYLDWIGRADEIIMVVDEPTKDDELEELIREVGGTYRYVQYTPTLARSGRDPWHISLELATGKWVVMLNANEVVVDPEALHSWLLQAEPLVTLVAPLFRRYTSDGTFIEQGYRPCIWRRELYRFKNGELEIIHATNGTGHQVHHIDLVVEYYPNTA